MDLNKAIEFAQLVNAAYAIPPDNLANSAGKALIAGDTAYTVVTTIYANDLATDINPGRGNNEVSIGFVCQADGTGDVVTDQELKALKGLNQLKALNVGRTKISRAGIERLRKALPKVRVGN